MDNRRLFQTVVVRRFLLGSFPWMVAAVALLSVAQSADFAERRQRAANEFHDGILLLHASSELNASADGFHQDPYFYYFTGLENTVGALLAIDGNSNESWLFLPSHPPFLRSGLQPEVKAGPDAEKNLALKHVVDWDELKGFFASHSAEKVSLYFASGSFHFAELPGNLLNTKSPEGPAWLQLILQKWAAFEGKEAGDRIQDLMAVQSVEEIAALRSVAKSTVAALMAGIGAVKPGSSQRSVESVVEDACWRAGAHGSSFWPWAMGGENAVFPHPFTSFGRYDHLNSILRPGDLVRLDVGCEWDHYQGDLGRTVPVSAHFDPDQRELWTIFVAAYQAGAKVLRAGVTIDQVFDAWRKELVNHRRSATSSLAQRAIESWSHRSQVPYWQVHTSNLATGTPVGPLRAGTTINFEPIASIDGQGFFLEDMYLITVTGAELLTPGVPYSAEAIEAAMGK
jgi:Xaa-Pro aminopeptidase